MAMPQRFPLYPPIPRRYRDVQWCAVIAEMETARLRPFIPDPLEPLPLAKSVVEVFVAHYGVSENGSYNEAGLLVPCRFGEVSGQTFAVLYLDSVPPLCAGREILGFPKKDGHVHFRREALANDQIRVEGRVWRSGVEILSMSCVFESSSAPEAGVAQRLPLGPRLQVRDIPSGDRPGLDSRTVFRKDFAPDAYRVREKRHGRGSLVLQDAPGDPLGALRPFTVIGAMYVVADFDLPYSEVLYHRNFRPNIG